MRRTMYLIVIILIFCITGCSNKEIEKEGKKHNTVTVEGDKNISNKTKSDNKTTLTEYILPNSDKDKLKSSNLETLSNEDLKLARNEIFARRGYICKDKNIKAYFESKTWYKPNQSYIETSFNNIEKYNISFIKQYEILKNNDSNGGDKFVSDKLGFSLAFPASWKGKFRIEEYDDGIIVCFKPKIKDENDEGQLFCITKKTDNLNENFLDTVGDKREFKAKGITYIIGAPTDVSFSDKHPEFETFLKMNRERGQILKTLEY